MLLKTHKEFVDVLFNKKQIRHRMKRIQRKLRRIGTYDVCKISLSCFDDKRYILGDGINSCKNVKILSKIWIVNKKFKCTMVFLMPPILHIEIRAYTY